MPEITREISPAEKSRYKHFATVKDSLCDQLQLFQMELAKQVEDGVAEEERIKVSVLDEEWGTFRLGYKERKDARVYNVVTVTSGDHKMVDERRLNNIFKKSVEDLEDRVNARIRR